MEQTYQHCDCSRFSKQDTDTIEKLMVRFIACHSDISLGLYILQWTLFTFNNTNSSGSLTSEVLRLIYLIQQQWLIHLFWITGDTWLHQPCLCTQAVSQVVCCMATCTILFSCGLFGHFFIDRANIFADTVWNVSYSSLPSNLESNIIITHCSNFISHNK